ncbi:MAG TPA: MBL fold metallo-hydrolase [Blastocatellia bacterium]|jgi:glyoxylase-like metal-dependent hydrolase (beta-lactamase superfamily II)|nr:MBL fold metallo-hydrolase [Blastocatellia bacterium]HAF25376.1 MBL fold metallo-hydrolase [Blastocatellia bacterium]
MQFGAHRVEIVPDTEFRLDGGAMFGVVPRTLWSRVCPPDEANRIRMNMNCVFIETGAERILIETGIGEKWSAKHTEMYGIARQRPLAESLRAIAGVGPEDVTIVINTHLHFDHAGGNTTINGEGQTVPAFPNARYFVSKDELEHAEAPGERDRASYFPDNWRPLLENGQLELKEAAYEVAPGLRMETYPGHNRSMQCWRLDANGKTLFGFADLVPMRAHVPFAWIMGYDLYPVETLEVKKKLLPQAAREGWGCLFYHDPDEPLCRLIEDEGKLRPVSIERI